MHTYESLQECLHHDFEFVKRYFAIAVLVDFRKYLLPHFFAYLGSHSKHFFDFVDRDGSASVLVVQGEGLFQLLVLQ